MNTTGLMPEFPCIENTLDVTVEGPCRCYRARLWTHYDFLDNALVPNDKVLEVQDMLRRASDSGSLIRQLAALPFVNAVQLQWWYTGRAEIKHGAVVYTVSFGDDPHG
jgi:hypothetical protein